MIIIMFLTLTIKTMFIEVLIGYHNQITTVGKACANKIVSSGGSRGGWGGGGLLELPFETKLFIFMENFQKNQEK